MPEPRARLLLVEDEPALRTLLERTLSREGYLVEAASDGVEGLSFLARVHPDLIITDIAMPRLNGISMVKELRSFLWGVNVPVIFYTNYPCSSLIECKLQDETCLPKADTTIEALLAHIKEKLQPLSNLPHTIVSELGVHEI